MANPSILIVEDERIVARDLEGILDGLGYRVVGSVASGEQAVETATAERPDLVLMDIVLEGEMSGVDATRAIRERIDIPIIYLTAYSDDATLQRAKATEPFGYLLKPFDERELHTSIEMALYKHRMERELRLSEQWLSTTLRSIGDAVIATDGDGRVKFINAAARSLTGWGEEEALGRELAEVYRIAPTASPADATEAGPSEGTVAAPRRLLSRGGAEYAVADTVAPIRQDDGTVRGEVLVFRDVTETLRFDQERQRVQKLESVGLLAGGIAHDFNNFLTAIVGNISYAKLVMDPDDESRGRLAEAERAAWRARDLTQQLLTFSRGGTPVTRPTVIGDLVEEAVGFALRGTPVLGEVTADDGLWAVEIDEGQVTQVFNNLLINAGQAMPGGGTARVHLENVELPEDHPSLLPAGAYVRATIRDHGTGIAAEHLPRIFDPYFTTKQRGSGLGLAVCYSIVKSHGGTIVAESELGAGSTFHVYLPATREEVDVPSLREVEVVQGKGKVLLMDDEDSIRELMEQALTAFGYRIACVPDGADAVELYRSAGERGVPFDVVLLDLTVPGGMGGLETLTRLRDLNPDVRAIVISGYSNDPVLADHARHGFAAAVSKPFNLEELSNVVAEVLADGG